MAFAPDTKATLAVNGQTFELFTATGPEGSALKESGWSMRVARRRSGVIGGPGLYADVDEPITLDFYGPDGTSLLAQIAQITEMLNIADQQEDNRDPQYATLAVQIKGSPNPPWLAIITSVPDSENLFNLPNTMHDMFMEEITGIDIVLRRRGLYLGTTPETISTPAGTAPTARTATFASLYTLHAMLQGAITFSSTAGLTFVPGGVWMIGGPIITFSGYSLTPTAAGWSVVNDAARNAYNTNVARYTIPEDGYPLTPHRTQMIQHPDLLNTHQLGGVTVVRNNTPGAVWLVRVVCQDRVNTIYGDWIPLAPGVNPQIVNLNTINLPGQILYTGLEVMETTRRGASIDLNYAQLISLDDPASRIIPVKGMNWANTFSARPAVTLRTNDWMRGRVGMTVDTTLNSQPVPLGPMTYEGSADLVTVGSQASSAWVAVGGANPASWQAVDSAGIIIATQWAATRWPCSLFPV